MQTSIQFIKYKAKKIKQLVYLYKIPNNKSKTTKINKMDRQISQNKKHKISNR